MTFTEGKGVAVMVDEEKGEVEEGLRKEGCVLPA